MLPVCRTSKTNGQARTRLAVRHLHREAEVAVFGIDIRCGILGESAEAAPVPTVPRRIN